MGGLSVHNHDVQVSFEVKLAVLPKVFLTTVIGNSNNTEFYLAIAFATKCSTACALKSVLTFYETATKISIHSLLSCRYYQIQLVLKA
jgi:hypothetical protein